MENLKKAFGLRLKELRKSKSLTQEKLSEMLDLSSRQLIRIENGENFPSVATLGQISLILNVELDSLFDFKWHSETFGSNEGRFLKSNLKLLKQGDMVIVEPVAGGFSWGFGPHFAMKFDEIDYFILKMAKEYNKILLVDYYENEKKFLVKSFSPSGEVKEILSKEDIFNEEQFDYIISKLKKISRDSKRLAFCKIAIDSMDDKEAFEKVENSHKRYGFGNLKIVNLNISLGD